jgi:hypothetical protein
MFKRRWRSASRLIDPYGFAGVILQEKISFFGGFRELSRGWFLIINRHPALPDAQNPFSGRKTSLAEGPTF